MEENMAPSEGSEAASSKEEGIAMPDTGGFRSNFLEYKIIELETLNEGLNDKVSSLQHDKATLEGIIERQNNIIDKQVEQLSEYGGALEKLNEKLDEIKNGSEERYKGILNILKTQLEPGLHRLHAETRKAVEEFVNNSSAETNKLIGEILGPDGRKAFEGQIISMYLSSERTLELVKHIGSELSSERKISEIRDRYISARLPRNP